MAYSSVAAVADGDVISAATINQLADNAAFVAGLAGAVNIPFVGEDTAAGAGFTGKYRIRHTHRYLHYLIGQIVSDSDNLDIYYDGGSIYNDGGNRSAPYQWSGYVDLDSTPGGLTVGDWYEVYADISQNSGSGISRLYYLLESPSTTL